MRGAWIALLALAAAAPAYGVHSLDLRKATRVASHVRKLDARNHFGLREHLGGAFTVEHPSCDPDYKTPRRMVCTYNAMALAADAVTHLRMRCTVEVTVRLHGLRRTTWRRHLTACAPSSIGQIPG